MLTFLEVMRNSPHGEPGRAGVKPPTKGNDRRGRSSTLRLHAIRHYGKKLQMVFLVRLAVRNIDNQYIVHGRFDALRISRGGVGECGIRVGGGRTVAERNQANWVSEKDHLANKSISILLKKYLHLS